MTNTTYHQSDSEAATVVPADQGVPMAARVAAVLLLLAALVNFLIFSVLAGSPTWWILGGGFGFVLLAGLILAPAVLAASLIVRPSRRAAWIAAAWTLPSIAHHLGFRAESGGYARSSYGSRLGRFLNEGA